MKKLAKVVMALCFMASTLIVPFVGNGYVQAAEKSIAVPEIKNDEYGITDVQQTKYSKVTFFRWKTTMDKKTNFDYVLHIYAEKKGKIKKVNSVNTKQFTTKTRKLVQKGDKDMACLSASGEKLYLPVSAKKSVPDLYEISLKSGKYKKISIEKQCKNIRKLKDYAKNSIKCYAISSRHLGLKMNMYTRNKDGVVNTTYKTCILDLKTKKIVKQMDCDFEVGSITERYVCGMEKNYNGKLCIQKWNRKVEKRDIENPPNKEAEKLKATDLTQLEDESRHVHKVFGDKNNIYFSTRAGVFCYQMKTDKILTLSNWEKSKYLKKYNYINAITKNAKGMVEVLVSTDWRYGYKLLRLN